MGDIRVNQVAFELTPGLRVNLGSYLGCNGWQMDFSYTRLYSDRRDTLNYIYDAKISAKQDLKYNVFDWKMMKTITFPYCFTLEPYFGVRAAWIYNELDINGSIQPITGDVSIEYTSKVENNFRGAGFESFWRLCWGTYDLKNRSPYNQYTVDTTLSYINSSYNTLKGVQSAFQLALGLNWGHYFCKCKYFLGLKAGYELNAYPDLIKLSRYSSFSK